MKRGEIQHDREHRELNVTIPRRQIGFVILKDLRVNAKGDMMLKNGYVASDSNT